MATSKGKSRAQIRAEDRIAAVRGSASRTDAPRRRQDGVPEVYQDMLSEAESFAQPDTLSDRPSKRRRINQDLGDLALATAAYSRKRPELNTQSARNALQQADSETEEQQKLQQTIEDSGDSNDEDIDWEEIGFDDNEPFPAIPARPDDEIADISVEVGVKKTSKKVAAKRKPITTVEKLLRMAVHEAHVLFLIFHLHVRNSWCNLESIQTTLKSFLPSKIIGMLHPKESLIQFSRSEKFIDGLKLAVNFWTGRFRVIESGMRRSQWADSPDEIKQQVNTIYDDIRPIDREGFVQRSSTLLGSQDVGNQLFCALLRSVGVEARLVCSLQPLPFGAAGAKSGTPMKGKPTVFADARSDGGTSAEEGSATGSASEVSMTPKGRRRKLGRPNFAIAGSSVAAPKVQPKQVKKSPAQRLDYPIFWVEAFDKAYQRWVPVDAMVTGTTNRPAKLEPPASYDQNAMNYVLAFDEHSNARDVTRRYTKAYNAKTRKTRIESTESGARWWRKALNPFRSPIHSDRDQVEDAELAKKEAQEGLPNNVQDFKDHPYYALERHLKRHEVIFPKRPVGKVNAGKSSNSNVENVYRRNDVQLVRSADKWYRVGREIKRNQQPLKHVPARRGIREREDSDGEAPLTALYAYSQTSLYTPAPVVSGRIPKNAYGNLDIYVPSMVPPGAVHIKHALSARAAKILGIDYADAVTGFSFKGRIGEAVKSGVIVASEYGEAIETVITGFQDAAQEAEDAKRSLESLRLWRRFLTGLRIGVRLGLYESDTFASGEAENLKKELDHVEEKDDEAMDAGGFFPDAGEETIPTKRRFSAFQPRSLLAAAQDDNEGLSDNEGPDEDIVDIAGSAPRLGRQRNVASRENNKDLAQSASRVVRGCKTPREESDLEDDSEDDFVPEIVRPTPTRRARGKTKQPSVQETRTDAAAKPTPRRSTRQTRSQKAHVEERDSDADMSVAELQPAEDHGGGFLPDAEESGAKGVGDGVVIEHAADKNHGEPEARSASLDRDAEDYGGGFILDDDAAEPSPSGEAIAEYQEEELQGGGFVPEHFESSTTARSTLMGNQSKVVEEEPRQHELAHEATLTSDARNHTDISKHEQDESHIRLVQRISDHDDIDVTGRGPFQAEKAQATTSEDATASISQNSDSLAVIGGQDEPVSEDDRGSLLSHDPEDEDAEPEWLNSD